MKHYIYKLGDTPTQQQLYVFQVSDKMEIKKVFLVIVHNNMETKIVLNIEEITKDLSHQPVVNSKILNLVHDMFDGMPLDNDDLISVDIENPSLQDTLEVTDDMLGPLTKYDDILKDILNVKKRDTE